VIKNNNNQKKKISLFLPSLRGGGAERVMLTLSQGFAQRGFAVDVVLAKAEGPYLQQVPVGVRIIDLKASRVLKSLPRLVRYLKKEKPAVLLSTLNHANIVALWAKMISGISLKVVVRVAATISQSTANATTLRELIMPKIMRRFYPWADKIIAISQGVADDLVKTVGLSSRKIKVIYNPAVTSDLIEKSLEKLNNSWFQPGEPPVILGVGRLTKQKDFPTLIHAFSIVSNTIPSRLVILGEGEERPRLETLVRELGLEKDVALPGFVENPFPYMRMSSVFVLSSAWEGFVNVLVEAMACGCPVVSTDCPSGPAEILDNGKYGPLIPVGNAKALAQGIISILESPPDPSLVQQRAAAYSVDSICKQYLDEIL